MQKCTHGKCTHGKSKCTHAGARYVLRLLSYYVEMQRKLNENGISEK